MEAKTRKVLLISVISGMVTLALGFLIWLVAFSSQFALYKENTFFLKIKYPKDWDVQSNPQQDIIVAFIAPKDGALDLFRENVNITVGDLSQSPMNLDELAKSMTQHMAMFFKNVKEVESVPTKLGEFQARRLVFETTEGDPLKMMMVFCIKNNTSYILTYTAMTNKYDLHLPLVNEMVNSFYIPKF